jgi:hypothetical protein
MMLEDLASFDDQGHLMLEDSQNRCHPSMRSMGAFFEAVLRGAIVCWLPCASGHQPRARRENKLHDFLSESVLSFSSSPNPILFIDLPPLWQDEAFSPLDPHSKFQGDNMDTVEFRRLKFQFQCQEMPQ